MTKCLEEMKDMNHTDSVAKEEVKTLIRQRDMVQKEMWYHYRMVDVRRNEVNEIEKVLREKCVHDWERDYCYYDRTYICRICNLQR